MLKKLLCTSTFMAVCISAQANNIDYLALETAANAIFCKNEGECEATTISTEVSSKGSFVVDGVTLPMDALRDESQQRDMLGASLYVKKDGEVASLPSDEQMLETATTLNAMNEKRRKVLPVPLFPPPEVSSSNRQVIISVE
jgi:hypothetical protein